MKTRFAISAALAGTLMLIASQVEHVAAAPASAAAAYREAKWEELVPKEWDPTKALRESQMSISDNDPRAQQMLREMQEAWANAPTNSGLDRATIKLPGYVVPLDETKAGIKEFLLVPYFGACIHTPPPPSNQIVHVIVDKPAKGVGMMDAVWVSGTLKTLRSDSVMGTSGYRMQAVQVEPYLAPGK